LLRIGAIAAAVRPTNAHTVTHRIALDRSDGTARDYPMLDTIRAARRRLGYGCLALIARVPLARTAVTGETAIVS
jgi:hypothetical protein